jgi:hypothetical protein
MTRHGRFVTIAAVSAASLALPATVASASSSDRHHLQLYKAEQQVDLNAGETKSASVSCNPGDYATDGMWRVDHVDQPNAQIPGADKTEKDIRVQDAHSTAVDKYSFTFVNPSGAQRAQLKIFVTCLGKKTAPDTHQHQFTISPQRSQSFGPAGPGVGYGFHNPADNCAPDEIAVAPGYTINSGSGRVVGSRTSLGGGEPPALSNWSMAFVFDAPSTWTTTYRCLKLESNTVSGHTTSIVPRFSPNPSMTFNSIAPGQTTEIQETCGEHEKGMVHAFDTDGPSAPYEYFLGMDPRIKTRAYRFQNAGPIPINVWTGVLCFNDRTS